VTASAPACADFAPATWACPTCQAVCRRHSVYTRKIKDISLDGPATLYVPVGYYRCDACERFFKPELPFAAKSKRYTDRAVRKATVAVQEDKTTYTALPHRLERDLAIRPAKSTGWAWFQRFAGSIDIDEYLRWACGRFSGQLSVDSVSDGDVQMWFATDPLNRDLILGYSRAKNANGETLAAFLVQLRDLYGIRPKLFTCDDANVFDGTPGQVWPGVPVQLCHFHAIKLLNYNYLRHTLTERIQRSKPVKPAKTERPDGTPLHRNSQGYNTAEAAYARLHYKQALEAWTELHRKRRLFFKSERSLREPESVKRLDAEFLASACERHPALAEFRRLILDFYAIMDSKDGAVAALLRDAFVARWAKAAEADKNIAHVVKQMGDERWFGRLFPFTAWENAHRTTNSTERANRWFRKRQKTHYRNRREHTIKNMLHADLIYRREQTPTGDPPRLLREKPANLRCSA
jgi:hypothetical protein